MFGLQFDTLQLLLVLLLGLRADAHDSGFSAVFVTLPNSDPYSSVFRISAFTSLFVIGAVIAYKVLSCVRSSPSATATSDNLQPPVRSKGKKGKLEKNTKKSGNKSKSSRARQPPMQDIAPKNASLVTSIHLVVKRTVSRVAAGVLGTIDTILTLCLAPFTYMRKALSKPQTQRRSSRSPVPRRASSTSPPPAVEPQVLNSWSFSARFKQFYARLRPARVQTQQDNTDQEDRPNRTPITATTDLHKECRLSLLTVILSNPESRGYVSIGILVLAYYFLQALPYTWSQLFTAIAEVRGDTSLLYKSIWAVVPAVYTFFSVYTACRFEKMAFWLETRYTSIITALHVFNCFATLMVPVFCAWIHPAHTLINGVVVTVATIVCLKLVSYAHTSTALRMLINSGRGGYVSIALHSATTHGHIWYFIFAPTFTYQLRYPRNEKTNWREVASMVAQLIVVAVVTHWVALTVVLPSIAEAAAMPTYSAAIVHAIIHTWAPCTAAWLMMFYSVFHLGCNLVAEILRFGDRGFYRDWWNATTFRQFWADWNAPIQKWLLKHVYCVITGASNGRPTSIEKQLGCIVVFFVSAVFHELIPSVTLHLIHHCGFICMMLQVPLVLLTDLPFFKRQPRLGNALIWVVMCVLLQPIAAVTYYRAVLTRDATTASTATLDTVATSLSDQLFNCSYPSVLTYNTTACT